MCLHVRQFLIVNNNLKADIIKFAEILWKNVNFGVVLFHFCTEKVTSTCIIRKWFNFLLLRQLQTVNKVPKVHLARWAWIPLEIVNFGKVYVSCFRSNWHPPPKMEMVQCYLRPSLVKCRGAGFQPVYRVSIDLKHIWKFWSRFP